MTTTLPKFAFNGDLTQGQKQFYDTYGFIIYKEALSQQEQATIIDEIDDLERRTLAKEIPSTDIDDITPMSITPEGKPFLHRLPYFTQYSPQARALIETKKFLAVGKKLLAEHAWMLTDTMHGTMLQKKLVAPRSQYASIHWHIDFRSNHALAPVISMGVYLDPSTVANGCLLVIPGSHRFPPGKYLPPAVPVEVEPGDVICHSSLLYHASTHPTEIGAIRRTLYLYVSAGEYPGIGLPFSGSETKKSVRTLFAGH